MELILRVPVKPYIKKYIAAEYPVEPYFNLTTTNRFGLFLYYCLSKPEKPRLDTAQDGGRISNRHLHLFIDNCGFYTSQKFTDTIFMRVGEFRWASRGLILTLESIVHFNKFCTMEFNAEFFRFVHQRIGAKGSINQAIEQFLSIHDISEDDLAFRTVQRAFQRRHFELNQDKQIYKYLKKSA